MIIAGGTIISSLMSDRLTKKMGTGLVVTIGVLMTGTALFGFSISGYFWMLCIFAVPYGLGAGAIDAAINNYVALHYASRHMNWLHCFWGVGATVGPHIMGFCLTNGWGWNSGYRTIFVIQIVFAAVLFFSLPMWKKRKSVMQDGQTAPSSANVLKLSQILRIKGVKLVLPAFFAYCAVEATTALWASSYLVLGRGISSETAAAYASLFFLGITGGRFLSGLVANKLGDRKMIYIGIAVIFIGIAAVWLPVKADWVCLYGLIIIGLGCAPIYPSIIHSTPNNFGAENSQAIVGVQMASAYTGATFMPPLFGLIANHINVNLFPVFLLVFAIMLLVMIRLLNKTVSQSA
jgi:fucose permease